jgi:L-aspartate oxidase
MNELIETDILIVGSGIAGGIAAIYLAESGLNVTIITRSNELHSSSTYYAQGGIVYEGSKDSPQLLEQDILAAGAGFCNKEAVSTIVKQGPDLVKKILIDRIGIEFDNEKKGKLSLSIEGAHSIPRILHTADQTGKTIELAIINTIQKLKNINIIKNATAIDLLTPSHHSLNRHDIYKPQSCVGAYFLDQQDGKVKRCLSKFTILATGGLGQIYLRTTNPKGARGDGIAMAYRAGARVINNEFIQFHPTTFIQESVTHFLISEAVRGAGAKLVNEDGNPFMDKYNSQYQDLASRDIVSRGIHQEMLLKDTSHVYLNMHSYISKNDIINKFPYVYKKCTEYGLDATKENIPVVPAAHYNCGGIWVDKWGRSSIQNCYAIGEVSCTGVHGANRLASVSLLEGLVWGYRSAKHISKKIKKIKRITSKEIPKWFDAAKIDPDPVLINQDMSVIKNIMWNYVGLIRSKRRLIRALSELRNLETEIEKFYRATRVTDELIGLRNAVRSSIIVTSAAWENKKSIGCHFREN